MKVYIGIPDPKNVTILVVTATGRGGHPKLWCYMNYKVGPYDRYKWGYNSYK